MKGFLLAILISAASICLLTSQAIAEITSSRHNLLVPYTTNGIMQGIVGNAYNNYGEVCVYCHTPHGGQSSNAPLWNRTMPATGNYTPYASSTMDATTGQPGGVSLACLSCHDGTIAVDSIANKPGSGYYTAGGSTTWGSNTAADHYALAQSGQSTTATGSCLLCHRSGSLAANASFEAMALTQNLSNQHPISIRYANYGGTILDPKFNEAFAGTNGYWFEEAGGIGDKADDNEVKLYPTGGVFMVECASCHNPHGTRAASGTSSNQIGRNGVDYATFLRKSNSSSALCTTCHIK